MKTFIFVILIVVFFNFSSTKVCNAAESDIFLLKKCEDISVNDIEIFKIYIYVFSEKYYETVENIVKNYDLNP